MTFVDKQIFLIRLEVVYLPLIFRLVAYNAAPGIISLILKHTADIKGDSSVIPTVLAHDSLNVTAVIKEISALHIYFPHATTYVIHKESACVPIYHIARQKERIGGWSPLSVHPTVTGSVKPEIEVRI